jgi:hypothetical protein
MAILTIHHWDHEQERGVRELRRVTRGPVVILTYDPHISGQMWLIADYLLEVARPDEHIFPSIDTLARCLGGSTAVETAEIPRDTPDWTLGPSGHTPSAFLTAMHATQPRALPGWVPRSLNALSRQLSATSATAAGIGATAAYANFRPSTSGFAS